MKRRRRRIAQGAVLFGLVALVFGCTTAKEGWGVLLWSPDEATYPTGSIVPIAAISQLNGTYDIQSGKKAPVESVPQWRVALFKRKSLAEEYRKEYSQYADLYAVATLDGLPVRAERDQDAKRIYKLRNGEVAKVLERDSEKSTAGEFEGYWYKLLTEGGATGYSFDKYLRILSATELAGRETSEEKDVFLESFLSSTFRPKYYRYMLDTNRIDLERFLPDYGIFPDPENDVIYIVNEVHASTIEYTGITRVTQNTYAFDGSSLLLIVKNANEINLQYSDKGTQYSEEYVRIDRDIDLIIIEETERRAAIFESIYSRGNTLTSSAYGTITLAEDGGFTWDGYERLVPGILTGASGNAGVVDFRLHLGTKPAKVYDGVITFIFNSSEVVHFLYTTENQGIRFRYLNYVPNDDKPLLVEDEGTSPIIIFFRITNEDAQ